MHSYNTQRVADLVGMKPGQVRHFARRNLVDPGKGPKGELRFTFQDLVLLRTAKRLLERQISTRKVFKALAKLKAGDGPAPPLSAVRMLAHGGGVVVCDEDGLWQVESGQGCLDFLRPELGVAVAPLWLEDEGAAGQDDELSSAEWCQLGVDLEEVNIGHALEAYERAVALDLNNADAQVNLGRLYQLKGNLKNAKRHYELAVAAAPDHQLANYNLGTLFDELSEVELAAGFYRKAPDLPDAHYNLARICRDQGDELACRRHCRLYQSLLERER